MEKNSSFKPAVIYARVSSKKQVKEGSGLESQNSRCRFYAQARGYDVVATFTDDMTGSKVRRPGMDAMLGFLKQNKAMPHVVLIDDISRLARGVDAHWKLRDSIAKAGGILESPSVKFGDDSDSHFIENVLASSSQHFRQKNREQTISRMKQRLRNGYYVQARPAAGYKYIKGNGKEIVRDKPVASIVQEALEGFNTGRFGSAGEVRQFLQDQPEFPKPKSGEVTHERAFVLLRNYTYAGMLDARNWKMGIIKGNHEPIISYEIFLKNQDLLVSKKRVSNRVNFTSITGWPGTYVAAEGAFEDASGSKRAAIFIGPEFGTVTRADLTAAAREALDARFDTLIACGFNFEAHTSELSKLGPLPILKAKMNPDLHMSDELKNTGAGNMFVVFGEPDIEWAFDDDGKIIVEVLGIDVFDPKTGEVRASGKDDIAAWFIDTNYNEESFFVRHAYFMGAQDPYKSLKTSLKAEIDKEAWQTLYRDTSRPLKMLNLDLPRWRNK